MSFASSIAKKAVSSVLGMAVFAGAIANAAPALAAAKSPEDFDRRQVIRRAKKWTSARVPYSQSGYRNGYRRDCSGFVSMAWGLPENLVTWNIPKVAKRIPKSALQPGDVLLNTRGMRHVVIFEKWADKSRTKYWALESTGQNGVERAVRRVVKYPYRFQGHLYKPYRYVGMDRYFRAIPKSDRQPVRNRAVQQAYAKKRELARKEARLRSERREAERRRRLELERIREEQARHGLIPTAATAALPAPARQPVSTPDADELEVVVVERGRSGEASASPMAALIQHIAVWMTGVE